MAYGSKSMYSSKMKRSGTSKGKTTKMDERKKKPANRRGKTSEGNIGAKKSGMKY